MLPDLDFEFRSSNMPRLAELIGYQGFPARPFGLKGHARREDQTLHLTDLELSLDRTVATVQMNSDIDLTFYLWFYPFNIVNNDAREFLR